MDTKQAQSQLNIVEEALSRQHQVAQPDGRYFVLWGWLVIVGLLSTHLLIQLEQTMVIPFVWAALGIFGAWKSNSHNKTPLDGAVRPEDRAIGNVWTFLALSFVLLPFVFAPLGIIAYDSINSLTMLLLGIGMAITGIIAQAKMMYGFAAFWLLASVGIYYVNSEYDLLIYALCIAIGYLLPGYMEKKSAD